jgi:hypothetical protein
METYDRLVEKWSPVLNEESAGTITDKHKKAVTAAILENTEKALNEQAEQASFGQMNEDAAATNNFCCKLEPSTNLIGTSFYAKPNGV